jgi:type IV secretory pathway VirB10-like protein
VATTDIDVELYELARLTLCQRYHQDQVGSMVRQWNAKIQKAQVAAIYTRPTKTESLRVKTEATELEDILAELHFLRKYFTESKTTFFASSTAGTKYNPPFVSHYTSRLHRDEEMHRRRQEEQKQEEEREQQQRKREERRHAERVREREKRRKEEARAREAKEKEERRRHEEKQRQEQERAKEAREREERNERARKRAAKLREERERKAEEQAAKERNEWDEIWISYSKRWDEIKSENPLISRFVWDMYTDAS